MQCTRPAGWGSVQLRHVMRPPHGTAFSVVSTLGSPGNLQSSHEPSHNPHSDKQSPCLQDGMPAGAEAVEPDRLPNL